MTPAPRIRILGIAGSLRTGSYNRALLRAARELAPDDVELVELDLRSLPHFDGDLEAAGDPEPVRELKDAIRDADALLIATPEYNRGTSGVLKNAIDWASRPPFASPLTGKPVAIVGATTGMSGTRRAQQQVRDALSFPGANVLEDSLAVTEAYERFEDDELADEATREQLRELVASLVAVVGAPELIAA